MRKYIKQNYLYLIIILISLISLFGAIIYRLYSLNNLGVGLSLVLAIGIFIILFYYLKNNYKKQNYNYKLSPPRPGGMAGKYPRQKDKSSATGLYLDKQLKTNKIMSYSFLFFYFIIYLVLFYILFKSQTNQAIISPWQVVPNYFFILYGLATIILIFLVLDNSRLSLLFISLHYFLSFSVALIVYKIGYGFDPFIHQATADLIDKTGAVYPKPFYYLGQYSLIVILHKITTLPIIWLDKLLVPVLAAISLPITIFYFLQKRFEDIKTSLLLILLMLILPFSFFIVTTPQNLAYLFLILVIFYGLTCSSLVELTVIYLLALATLAIHPLAGIPALFFAFTLTVYHSDKTKLKKYFYLLIFILSSISLPLAFYFINKNSLVAKTTLESLPPQPKLWPKIIIPNQENFILNFIYLYGFNIKIIISLLVIIGILIAYRHRQECRIFFISLGMALSLGIAYVLTRQLSFNFLIEYEQTSYLDRILVIIIFFLLPFIIISLYGLAEKILKKPKIIKIPLFLFLVILITVSLYLSYPRFDRYHNSHGLSVSQNDIEAIHWIENNAGSDYIVLANQQVSAAALHEFGFSRYYKLPPDKGDWGDYDEIYFYPIPTGGQLYQYYLNMVYKKPDKKTMTEAMSLTGVNQSYFILNKYWWAFDKILAEAKLEADSWQEIGGGKIYIFKYERQ